MTALWHLIVVVALNPATWYLIVFLLGLGLGITLTVQHHQALRDDRHYQEQAYWAAHDQCERAWRHLRYLSSHPRLAYRVFRRAERITARREAVG